jgi:hypothetical protein
MDAQAAIMSSISTNEIVTLDYSEDLEDELLCACEDNAESNVVMEFWGTTPGGKEWRVHLIRA